MRRIKLGVITFLTVLACFCFNRQPAGATQEQPRPRVEVVGFGTPMSERPGVDDGAAFVVHFTGDTHGSLEECG